MTRDELVAKIESATDNLGACIAHLERMIGAGSHMTEPDWALVQYLDIAKESLKHSNALLEIAQVHNPASFESDYGTITICAECNYEYFWSPDNDDDRWPCDTAKAIEKALT